MFGTLGAVASAAFECANDTLIEHLHPAFGQGQIAVDSKNTVWFAPGEYGCHIDDKCSDNVLWMCQQGEGHGPCIEVGSGWTNPSGIAVDASGPVASVYVAEQPVNGGVGNFNKCVWDGTLNCTSKVKMDVQDVDAMSYQKSTSILGSVEDNVWVAGGGRLWKCGDTFEGDNFEDGCLEIGEKNFFSTHDYYPSQFAIDSKGLAYVTGGWSIGDTHYAKCRPSGECVDVQPKDYVTGEVLKGGGYGNKIAVDSNDNLHMAVGSRLYRCSSDNICDVIGTLDGEVDTMTFGQDGALYTYESTGRSTGDVASLRRVCLPPQSSNVKSESDASKAFALI